MAANPEAKNLPAGSERRAALLDMIENGEFGVGDDDGDEEADQLPFETLTTFFLVGERLQRNPLDAETT